MLKITARLEQLTCPDCARLLEQTLARQPGVEQASVRYATSKLVVTLDPATTGINQLAAITARLGYKVEAVLKEETI